MGGLFGGSAPKPPKPPEPPPPPPTVDEARQSAENEQRLRRRKGRAANILTGKDGVSEEPTVGTHALLGGG